MQQTGLSGPPTEPLVSSFALVGTELEDPPDLQDSFNRLRETLVGLRQLARERGWPVADGWSLLRVTTDGRQRSFSFANDDIDAQVWDETVSGVPSRFDTVSLYDGYRRASYNAPSHGRFFGSKIRSIEAEISNPAEGILSASVEFLDLLREGARVARVQTGFVHVDSIPDPYTQLVTAPARLSGDRFEHEVHGYYWALLLNPGHLARLGGAERVRREAPCEVVQLVDNAEHGEAVICALTENPLHVDAERFLAWREFLRPVLRIGYPTNRETVPFNMRSPVWIFEGEPTLEMTRFILSRGDDDGSTKLPVTIASDVEDPETPSVWLYPGSDFSREEHEPVIRASVRAWCLTAVAGKLAGVDRPASRFTDVSWDTSEDEVRALVFQISLADTRSSLDRLNALLVSVERALLGSDDGRLIKHIVVR